MDVESQSAVRLLEALQDAMSGLREIRKHYSAVGSQPQAPFLLLSGRPFRVGENASVREFHGSVALGLGVRGVDRREYELVIDLLWDSVGWTITTQAWVDSELKNQELLRELPDRTASGLVACTEQLQAAISNLVRFEDLVTGKAKS